MVHSYGYKSSYTIYHSRNNNFSASGVCICVVGSSTIDFYSQKDD